MNRIARDTTTWIALLRAVNLAGHWKIAMAELRDLAVTLGFANPRTLLQSGNLVFGDAGRSSHSLETLLEDSIAKRFALRTDVFVRSASDWQRIVEANPFPGEAERDPAHLLVVCLKHAPSTSEVHALQAAITGPETVAAAGKQLYAVFPAGIGRSKLTMSAIERALRTRGTGRNWNTVLKLEALAKG